MRGWPWLVGCVIVGLASPAYATTVEELEAKLEAQAKQIQELQQQVSSLKQGQGATALPAAETAQDRSWPTQSERFARRGEAPAFGGIASKPFLRREGRNVYVGGYADIEYKNAQHSNAALRQHRLIPFIYADVSDQVKFATEIEIEDGGPQNNADDGEIKIEFATIDYLLVDAFNLRGGIVLSPLGKLNLVHDSPLQDLTERPLVDQFVIPTTLSEAAVGAFGSVYPTESAKVDYELYLTNGFRGLTGESPGDVTFSRTNGLRGSRGSQNSDINEEPAVVGRLAASPWLGWEVGASTHLGTYDTQGKNTLGIYALDTTYQYGPFELLAEGAYAAIERAGLAKQLGVPDDMYGYYLQGNYRFMPEWLRQRASRIFRDESTFTFVNRWDWINLDGNRSQRYTIGLNFRPIEDTVFKTDFQFNWESGLLDSTENNAVLFSAATYF
ncbi:MAG: hypothetical protein HYZ92_00735 [Candidatus Omnitrophica bacterium]|nr:hypothetical protein [Candidatus Omnitrophota bacterium]